MNKLIIITSLFFLIACDKKQIEFDKIKWTKRFDGFYQYREVMVKDLMKNHLREGMSYHEIVDLIGKPENFHNINTNTIGYTIMEDYGWDIDPVETKILYIEMSSDSLIQNVLLEHWKR